MKTIILGSGVVGVTTAYYLQRHGHEVTVIDRADAAAMETSFANGGQISASHAEPWCNPSLFAKLPGWLMRADAPLVFRPRLDPAMWRFALGFLRNSLPGPTRVNTERIWRIAEYSRLQLKALREEEGLEYDQLQRGILHFYQDQKGFEHAARGAEAMRKLGCRQEVLDADGCVEHEPALADIRDKLAGGVLSPDDESGDAHAFTQSLAALCAERGVRFQYGATIEGLELDGDRIAAVRTDKGRMEADNVVAALGSYTPLLLKQIGLKVPVYPLKGYSVTVPIGGHNGAPHGSLTDDARKIVFTRLGDRLRAAGTAELNGYNTDIDPVRSRAVLEAVKDVFPNGGDMSKAEFWAGLRPGSPDCVPMLGPTRYKNLFLNTGHGTLGWTMACGSGKLVADIIAGAETDIDPDGLTLARFGS